MFALKHPQPDSPVVTTPNSHDDAITSSSQVYRCAQCQLAIARPADELSIGGTTHHTRTNGAGFIHRFITFSVVTNVSIHGEPTEDFTWFDGFTWEYAVCHQCGSHLGWCYRPAVTSEIRGFYGLLTTALYLSAE